MELQKLCDGYYIVENGKCVYKSKSKQQIRNYITDMSNIISHDKQKLLNQLYLEG